MKKILVSLVAMMFLVVPMAFGITLDLDSDYYLGSIMPSNPADPVSETLYIEALIPLALNGTAIVLGNTATRSDEPFSNLPDPVFAFKVDQEIKDADGNKIGENFPEETDLDFFSMNYDYVLGKYGRNSYVWYIAGVSDFTLSGKISQGLSHYSFFGKTEKVPEPATLLLFGAGIAGLALYRRKRS